MTKAIRMMEDNLRLVDALIYVIDARAVYSCDNPLFNKLLQGKRVLYVFNKCDLVEKSDLDAWCELFKKQGKPYVKAIGTSGDCSQIVAGLKQVVSDKIEKYAAKGANISVRAMVVGVPNSGKSTIINSMVKRQKRLRVTVRELREASNGFQSTTWTFWTPRARFGASSTTKRLRITLRISALSGTISSMKASLRTIFSMK